MVKHEIFYQEGDHETHISEIEQLWEAFFPTFNKLATKAFMEAGIIPSKDYSFEPDFAKSETWKIKVKIIKSYDSIKAEIENTEVLEAEGFLFFTLKGIIIRPSFKFKWWDDKISVNKETVEEIMKNHIQEKTQVDLYLGEDTTHVEVFNKLTEDIKKKIEKEANSAFHNLGFSEEESNLMILSAMESDKFHRDMPVDDFIGLALRTRNENMQKNNQ